jgi:hypothetical protein
MPCRDPFKGFLLWPASAKELFVERSMQLSAPGAG